MACKKCRTISLGNQVKHKNILYIYLGGSFLVLTGSHEGSGLELHNLQPPFPTVRRPAPGPTQPAQSHPGAFAGTGPNVPHLLPLGQSRFQILTLRIFPSIWPILITSFCTFFSTRGGHACCY